MNLWSQRGAKDVRRESRQKRQSWRLAIMGLGLLWLGLVGCRTTGYTVVGSGGGVQLGPVDLELRSHGQRLPCFTHGGQFYVVGRRGMPYAIWIQNRTAQRLEVVVSVDGRDVITGRRQRPHHRGYILNPYRHVNITGYRTSLQSVAAFRFSSIHRSYSARKGSSWFKVGSIIVSVYNERGRRIYGRPLVQQRRRRYSRSPSILRKRGYAATPPRAGAVTTVKKPRRYRPRVRRYARRYKRPAARPRLGDVAPMGRGSYAPPPSAPSRAPRKAAPAPSGGATNDSVTARRQSRSKSFSGGRVYRRRARRHSYRHRENRSSDHGYRHPAPPEGLGTAFGERRYAPARFTTFVRASSHPSYVLKIMYNNCAAYRYIGLCTPWCPCYRPQPAPQPYTQHDPSVP